MSISEIVVDLFWASFPTSLLIIIIPIVYLWYRSRQKGFEIINRVEFFHKGGTKQFLPCTLVGDTIEFKVGETNHIVPIIAHPRIETSKSKTYRTYLVAQGTGETMDVPKLTPTERDKIVSHMKQMSIYAADEDGAEKTDDELIKLIELYNFDVEQILDRPMIKAFTVAINAYEHVQERLQKISQDESISKLYTLSIGVVGVIIGVLLGFYLVAKGVL